ncbi:Down syndrome cell adhesion molecule-like protein Dscam2 [Bactrocera dorsalis]|uniref:Down syndrome cell adhesion molecule-like protein Dscam2 n=1 Tax=Bactrocera dorsalis TaxID=27457 RepID=A0ABM3J0U9_BACDO|nr:Down syndrome cell adhesion molecule-like protein Dscam2 [Bactrocera dorsalis]
MAAGTKFQYIPIARRRWEKSYATDRRTSGVQHHSHRCAQSLSLPHPSQVDAGLRCEQQYGQNSIDCWHTKRPNNEESIQHLLATGRAKIKEGTLIITAVDRSDSGAFFCTATNSEGSETLEVQIAVTSPLTASIQPTVQTVNLGKTANLICSISGFPKQSVLWLKDGQPLRSGARVRLLSTEHIRITSITKEDKGMYQCIVKNDLESAQATAELRLGEVAPQLIYKFIEQTIQPGPSVSLKCSASGNPTPKIVWHLDGFPLPNVSMATLLIYLIYIIMYN